MKKRSSKLPDVLMLLLALCPILSQYVYGGLSYATWSFLFVIPFIVISKKSQDWIIFPRGYKLYWAYLAVIYLILTHKISAIIPGGVTFFAFSLSLIFVAKHFNITTYKIYLRILFIITAILFVAQEIMWYTTGVRFVPIPPLGELSTTLTYSEMVARNTYASRSSSLFFEPSHYAVFLLVFLMIELFENKGKRVISGYAIATILIVLFLRSGTGLVGLAVVLLFKLLSYISQLSVGKKILVLTAFVLVSAFLVQLYMRTEAGEEMFERTDELTLDESGHSYTRLAVGYLIYDELPTINKIIGASDDVLLPAALKWSRVSTYEEAALLYMNGLQNILTHTGIIGLLFFLIILILLCQGNNSLSKCAICLFVVLSLFEQTYCRPIMLITMIIATFFQNSKSELIQIKQ